ncbi:uncharacterized protein LOC119741570 [Patiria miniata]|uniref:Uncharacterized protein n=1 Tax=Patiria miniata TaxID=46514 RepID=A0A914BB70_PATMI|nr:uncharacterized protein LOC119741570 [Patiria miniata]
MSTITIKVLSRNAYPKKFDHALQVVTSDNKLFELFLPEDQTHKLEQGKFYKLVGCNAFIVKSTNKHAFKLTHKTRIFYTAPFPIAQEVEDSFFHAKKVTIPEAVALPKDTRVSMRGVIEAVSPVKEGPSYSLQSLDLVDNTRNKKITVNLWGRNSEVQIPPSGTEVTVENLLTDSYQDRVVLKATQETTFLTEEAPAATAKTVTFVAFIEDSNNITFLDDLDIEYYSTAELLCNTLAIQQPAEAHQHLPLTVNIELQTVTGKNTITSMAKTCDSSDNNDESPK